MKDVSKIVKKQTKFSTHISDKAQVSRIHKCIKNFQNSTNNPIKKISRNVNRHLTSEDVQMANKHMK